MILHQTYKTSDIPSRWQKPHQNCIDLHPNWTHILWTDLELRQFIENHYPSFLSTFDGYSYPIQRVDAARYFILYHFGGVYLDLDVGCVRPLDDLLWLPAAVPKTEPIGFSNDVMMSEIGHPFYKQLMDALPRWNVWYGLPYLTMYFLNDSRFMSTGPMFLNLQLAMYPNYSNSSPVYILSPQLYSGGPPHAYFGHYEGNSWHEKDATLVFILWWFIKPKGLLCLSLIGLVVYRYRKSFCVMRWRYDRVQADLHEP